jgi:hypothetical protein
MRSHSFCAPCLDCGFDPNIKQGEDSGRDTTSSRGIAQLYISSMVTYLPVLQKFGSSGVHQKISSQKSMLFIPGFLD